MKIASWSLEIDIQSLMQKPNQHQLWVKLISNAFDVTIESASAPGEIGHRISQA
jgi:hypothetical protein